MSKRGMALLLVLTVASVVVMLTGAFVASNHSNFATLGATQRQREAHMASESACNFLYFKLEHDQLFGKVAFTTPTDISPPGGGIRVHKVVAAFPCIAGALVDENGNGREPTFTVNITNNLDTEDPTANGPKVPKDSVLLQVVGRSGGFEDRCDVLYRGEPLYDASVTANKEIDLTGSDSIHIKSVDPARNWVRSNGDIKLNKFLTDPDKDTTIQKLAGNPKGVMWAKQEIRVGNQPLQGADLNLAAEKSGGILAPKSRLNHDIYKLELKDLNVGGTDAGYTTSKMAPGTYCISEAPVRWLNQEGGYDTVNVKVVCHVAPDGSRTNYYNGSRLTNPNLIFPSDGWTNAVKDEDGTVVIGDSAMTFNFDTDTFAAAANATIEVDGDLRIISQLDGHIPKIKLISEGASTGVIKSTGSIEIQGTLSGGGALLAQNELKLMCNPQTHHGDGADVDADKTSGVVLYGDNVTMYGGNTNTISFKGLVYAEHDFTVQGGVQIETQNGQLHWKATNDRVDSLEFEGAVVARQGNVQINSSDKVTFTYNQHYLKALTKGMPDDRRRIRHVWTRSY